MAVLELAFTCSDGRRRRIRIRDPKDGLTQDEVENAMNLVISKQAFQWSGGAVPTGIYEAVIRDTTETQIIEPQE